MLCIHEIKINECNANKEKDSANAIGFGDVLLR